MRTALAFGVIGTAALLPAYAAAQCTAPGQVLLLEDGERYRWDVAENGQIGDGGRSPAGPFDAFDNGFALRVDGAYFPAAARTTELAGEQVVHGPTPMGRLQVTRKLYAPAGVTPGYARFLEIFTNTTTSAAGITVRIETNVGSNAATAVTDTSSGDQTYATNDRWVATDDGDAVNDPSLAHNYWGSGAAVTPQAAGTTVYACSGTQGVFAEFRVSVPANATRILMHFASQNPDRARARSRAQELDAQTATSMFTGLTTRDRLRIVNWNLIPATMFATTLNGTRDSLTRIDLTNGTFTRNGSTLDAGGLAFTADAVLLTILRPTSAANSVIGTFDLDSGATAAIGMPMGTNNVDVLEADAFDNVYAGGSDGALYLIDPFGLPVLLGNMGITPRDFAFDAAGTLWAAGRTTGATGDALYTIDTVTGAATLRAAITGVSSIIGGLAISPGGTFYVTARATPGGLYTLDPQTGATTAIGAATAPMPGYGELFTGFLPICGNGIVEAAEQCDLGFTPSECCAAGCTFAPNTSICRAATEPCDLPERCTGLSDTCPTDQVSSSTVACRIPAGSCDPAERCDGAGKGCPPDILAASSVRCRELAGPCDLEEYCTGAAPTCPTDQFTGMISCRPAIDDCDETELCTGQGAECPPDQISGAGMLCRPSNGGCDLLEHCDGLSTTCPADRIQPAGIACRLLAGVCDQIERCDGVGPECPADAFHDANVTCRRTNDSCDLIEYCPGTGADCPEDQRIDGCCNDDLDCNDVDPCTADVCDLTAATCSANPIFRCCTEDADCGDGTACTADSCDQNTLRCVFTPITPCCNGDDTCADDSACTTESCMLSTGTCTSSTTAGCCVLDGDCYDGDTCTIDQCTNNTCTHARNPACPEPDAGIAADAGAEENDGGEERDGEIADGGEESDGGGDAEAEDAAETARDTGAGAGDARARDDAASGAGGDAASAADATSAPSSDAGGCGCAATHHAKSAKWIGLARFAPYAYLVFLIVLGLARGSAKRLRSPAKAGDGWPPPH